MTCCHRHSHRQLEYRQATVYRWAGLPVCYSTNILHRRPTWTSRTRLPTTRITRFATFLHIYETNPRNSVDHHFRYKVRKYFQTLFKFTSSNQNIGRRLTIENILRNIELSNELPLALPCSHFVVCTFKVLSFVFSCDGILRT